MRRVDIPKADGGTRPLGIPTVADRVAQEVARRCLEPILEPVFHADSYGCEPSGLSGRQRHFRTDQIGWVGYVEQRNGAMGQGIEALYPGVKIEIEGKGSATAPPALLEGEAQFGPMSRPMTKGEVDAFEKKYGYKPAHFRVAADALAIYVNKDNPILCLTMQQVDQIFSATRQGSGSRSIDTWGEVGLTGEWATKPIAIYGRIEGDDIFGRPRHVGDDEADAWIEIARMPFDLGDDPAWLRPASGPDSRSWRSIVELRLMSPDRALEQEAGGALGGSLNSSRRASSSI